MGEIFASHLTQLYLDKKDLTKEDLISGLREFLDRSLETISVFYETAHKKVELSASRAASKDDIVKTAIVKVAIDDSYLEEALQRSLKNVKSLTPEVVENIKDKFFGEPILNIKSLVRKLVGEEEIKLKEDESLTPRQLKEALNKVWRNQKWKLERVVRTEIMGCRTRAELKDWFDRGYEWVERIEMKDNKTCDKCKILNGRRYRIEDLLKLNNPLIEDPNRIGQLLSHPSCRGNFKLLRDTQLLKDKYRELLKHPTNKIETSGNVTVKNTTVKNVPLDYQQSVKNVLNEVQPKSDMKYLIDIIYSDEYRSEQVTKYLMQGKKIKEAEQLVLEEIKRDKGELLTYENDKEEVSISAVASDIESPAQTIARQKGVEVWFSAPKNIQEKVLNGYEIKKREESYTLEDEGIQVIGGHNFITPLASESPVWYFADCYSLYITNPIALRAFDMEMYVLMRENFFSGKEYYQRGGIK